MKTSPQVVAAAEAGVPSEHAAHNALCVIADISLQAVAVVELITGDGFTTFNDMNADRQQALMNLLLEMSCNVNTKAMAVLLPFPDAGDRE